MGDSVIIDGSHGVGGGQILRTALTLSAITGRLLAIQRLRAGRPKPGLAAQHLTAVLSAAELFRAAVSGATLGSETLSFQPTVPPRACDYLFDVAAAREGGSAGAATLVLQTVALPALFAGGASHFCIRGATHVPWSPPYDYIAHVWRPFLTRMGISLDVELARFGFLPVGQGEITGTRLRAPEPGQRPSHAGGDHRAGTRFARCRAARLQPICRRTLPSAWLPARRHCSRVGLRPSTYERRT